MAKTVDISFFMFHLGQRIVGQLGACLSGLIFNGCRIMPYTVREIGILFVAAQIFKREHGKRLLRDRYGSRLVDPMAKHELVCQQQLPD